MRPNELGSLLPIFVTSLLCSSVGLARNKSVDRTDAETIGIAGNVPGACHSLGRGAKNKELEFFSGSLVSLSQKFKKDRTFHSSRAVKEVGRGGICKKVNRESYLNAYQWKNE